MHSSVDDSVSPRASPPAESMSSGAKEPLLPRHRPTRFGAAAGGIPRSVFGLPILRPDTGFYRAWSALILFLDLTYSALVVGVGRLGGRGGEIVCVRVGRSVCVCGGEGGDAVEGERHVCRIAWALCRDVSCSTHDACRVVPPSAHAGPDQPGHADVFFTVELDDCAGLRCRYEACRLVFEGGWHARDARRRRSPRHAVLGRRLGCVTNFPNPVSLPAQQSPPPVHAAPKKTNTRMQALCSSPTCSSPSMWATSRCTT